MVNLVHTKLQL